MRMKKILSVLLREPVAFAAGLLAVISAFFVPPDREYLGYADLRTMGLLFSLMTVVAGLRSEGVLDQLAGALLNRTRSARSAVLVLSGLCFFGSMLLTNDVSLLAFVPLTFAVLERMNRKKLAGICICLQTLAANLGSMLTPSGNPQNLYLYGKSGLSFLDFLRLMAPYAAASAVLIVLSALLFVRGGEKLTISPDTGEKKPGWRAWLHGGLFLLCLLCVARVLPWQVAAIAVAAAALVFDRRALKQVDWMLLVTFLLFFILTGNLSRLEAFSNLLRRALSGREVLISVLASQVISNVPAALLLSGFTENLSALIIGVNLGGLGTLIASMASLISYRQIAAWDTSVRGRYFWLFTVMNVVFLLILLAFYWVLQII